MNSPILLFTLQPLIIKVPTDSGGCFKSAAKLRECALMMKCLGF